MLRNVVEHCARERAAARVFARRAQLLKFTRMLFLHELCTCVKTRGSRLQTGKKGKHVAEPFASKC